MGGIAGATLWLLVCVRLGILVFGEGNMNAVEGLAIFGFPSSLVFGGISNSLWLATLGHQNLYLDFLAIGAGGLLQYALIGSLVVWIGRRLVARLGRH
jgi:hypothetical protein